MNYTFSSNKTKQKINAISSKSEAHRLLICAALSDGETCIVCNDTNQDIDATVSCLNSLGASIIRAENEDGEKYFNVTPIGEIPSYAAFDCGESGSTLRFLLPVVAALGIECDIYMHGRLPERPLSPLYELLAENGVTLSPQGSNPLHISGRLKSGNYEIAGNISSQFISGLLFALPFADGDSTLTMTGKLESTPYITMTEQALEIFGAQIRNDGNVFYIQRANSCVGLNRFTTPHHVFVGGDWSNAAFFLCAGALSKDGVAVMGLDLNSAQGDREILNILKRMGASISHANNTITVKKADLFGIEIDASQIPDLVPVISVVASVAMGKTKIYNASRLRLKESDRLQSVCDMLTTLGADIKQTSDGLIIHGKSSLCGGTVSSCNDHRIAMSAAVASLVCTSPVTVEGIEAIKKSYPAFLSDFIV
ncbi:MAG: 3-phosphoshikimate 1-carboxyvinyltransferase [Ruminococcaceae bacterium]|nr:3-phosphoshikimate 1-carboxyvinyltransferase [Oscillospiraceae bacterium]